MLQARCPGFLDLDLGAFLTGKTFAANLRKLQPVAFI
jgi:hypothetical protein